MGADVVGSRSRQRTRSIRSSDELGRLDTVVNNAGLMRIGPAVDGQPRGLGHMLAVNVSGLALRDKGERCRISIAAAADSPRGVADVVNISSTAGRVARPGTAVYALTKFGVGAFSEGMRQELLGQRVRVSLVEPGTVQTEITDNLPPEDRPPDARTSHRRHGETGARRHRRCRHLSSSPAIVAWR